MNRSLIISWTPFILLSIASVFLLLRNRELQVKIHSIQLLVDGLETNSNNLTIANENMKTTFRYFLTTNVKLRPNTEITSEDGQIRYISDLVTKRPIHIIYIPENTCNSCYEEVFQLQINPQMTEMKYNTIVLVPLIKLRSYIKQLKNYGIDFPIFGWQSEIDLGSTNPFILKLDSSLVIKEAFMVNRNDISVTGDYLEYLQMN